MAGTSFGFGDTASAYKDYWSEYTPGGLLFDIGTAGDNLFLYCLNADNEPHIITAFTNVGVWLDGDLGEATYGTNSSALPDALADAGSLALPHYDNCIYAGPLRLNADGSEINQQQIREYLITPSYWECQDAPRIFLEGQEGRTASDAAAITTMSSTVMTMIFGIATTAMMMMVSL